MACRLTIELRCWCEWLGAQPWCTGKIGTYGGSQAGYAQNYLAVTQPPHLVAQYMTDTGLSLYHEGYRIGGATKPQRFIKGGAVARDIKDRLEYMYDFGDGWEHVLTLEKVLEAGEHQTPVCLKGARSCPPEDCGGAWGYANLLEIIKDPTHEEYEQWKTWLPEDFDPEQCDLEEINSGLSVRQWTIAPPSRKGRRK